MAIARCQNYHQSGSEAKGEYCNTKLRPVFIFIGMYKSRIGHFCSTCMEVDVDREGWKAAELKEQKMSAAKSQPSDI